MFFGLTEAPDVYALFIIKKRPIGRFQNRET